MAKDDNGHACVTGADMLVHRQNILDHAVKAVTRGKHPLGRVGRGGLAVAAVVMGEKGKARIRQRAGKTAVTPGMFGHAVIDMHGRPDTPLGHA